MAPSLESRDFALYNGVSNRSRGWKSRRLGELAEAAHAPRHTGIKRWDGKAGTSMAWDGLRRDPELWFRHGNCFVHLYARGQSRRGPAFKLPFSTLLASQCHALIERFITRDMPTVPDASDMHDNSMLQPMPVPPPLATLDYWSRAHLLGRVDLYIPPPQNADKDQTLLYYLAIRNLFAWIFRRPVVGEHLGSALAGLFSAMREFRHPKVDHVQDLLCYLEDEGYLAMAGHPDYALAVLHLAETMRFRDLYVDAFAHCVGMYNNLYLGSEYQYISSASRKLIRRARLDMDLRLGSAGSMLSDFLEDDLSATHLGLPEPARAHMDRFRTYIQGFYTTRLGYYPPISIDARSTIFEPHVYRVLAEDFQALYDYLVDGTFTAESTGPALAQGGICAMQCVKSFDERHKYPSLPHPLPLLPEVSLQPQSSGNGSGGVNSNGNAGSSKANASSRRMSWFGAKTMDRLLLSRSEKLKPDTRLLAHAALLKASNKNRSDLWRNDFVCAYRQFEEDSVFKPYKADRMEKISMIDARKVRWILVYAVHQTLQNCFIPPPPEVNNAETVSYHISISAKHLPSWNAEDQSAQVNPVFGPYPAPPASPSPTAAEATTTTSNSPARSMSMTALTAATAARSADEIVGSRGRTVSPVFDIRPDIDYLGLANRTDAAPSNGEVTMLPRSRSLTRSLSQKAAFRRSLSLFRGNSSNGTQPTQGPAKLQKGKQPEAPEKPAEQIPPIPARTRRGSPSPHPSSQAKEKQRAISRERRSSPYHEIVVHGYGNGTNPVHLAVSTNVTDQDGNKEHDEADPADDSVSTPSTSRSLSTSSTNSNTSAATADTAATALTEATSTSSVDCASAAVVTDTAFVESPTVAQIPSRSSSVYSNASSKAARKPSLTPTALATLEPPAIPPRGRPKALQAQSPAISRSSSVYSNASAKEDVPALPRGSNVAAHVAAVLRKTPPPPVPARNSARHRRFSVYGGGDEYAGAVLPLAATATRGSNSSSSHVGPLNMDRRPKKLQHQHQQKQPPYQRLDMVQEALLAVQETMEQQGIAQAASAPISRASSFVGVAALRSVNEDDELTAMTATARSRAGARHRHSSYHGRNDDAADDGDDVQPEWEKFAVGLGGHTAV